MKLLLTLLLTLPLFSMEIIVDSDLNPAYKEMIDEMLNPELKRERELYERAQSENSSDLYQQYIDEFPNGKFISEARKTYEKLGITHNGHTYKTVKSPFTGKVWLDRNLGAKRVCQNYDDEQCYGDYLTWSESNNACPSGFRTPTIQELKNETISGGGVKNRNDAFNNFLKLASAGRRASVDGSFYGQGSYGRVWSSSASGSYSHYLDLRSSKADTYESGRVEGQSVRCLKD